MYCLTLSILRLLISCPRLVFSIILLSQQHDCLPQPCNVYVCIDTDIDIHTHMLPVLLQGLIVLWLLCSVLAFAELPRAAAIPPCLRLPQAAFSSAHWQKPISTPPYNSLLSSFSGSFKVFRRIHTLKLRLSASVCFSLEDPSEESAQFFSMLWLSLQASPL